MNLQQNHTNKSSQQLQPYRFRLTIDDMTSAGSASPRKTVGMAYLQEGQGTYTLRIWTFLNDRFYLIPHKEDGSRFYIMSRETNKIQGAKNKYFWNIVGQGKVDALKGHIRLDFDLFEKPILMSIFPEKKIGSLNLAVPEFLTDAA